MKQCKILQKFNKIKNIKLQILKLKEINKIKLKDKPLYNKIKINLLNQEEILKELDNLLVKLRIY